MPTASSSPPRWRRGCASPPRSNWPGSKRRPAGADRHRAVRSGPVRLGSLRAHRREGIMAYGSDRFLTTHTGSLPRPEDLIRAMFAKEEGVPVDAAALMARIRSAVAEVVKKQVAAGIDIVDDGEFSKPSYATYVKDRLSGFDGTSQPLQYQDLVDFPGMARRVFGDPGRARRRTPACTGPVTVRDVRAAQTDIENLKAAL